MKLVNEFDVTNKTVILRSDLNISVKDGKIISDERIKKSLKTINYLIDNNAKVILLSHFGKIKSKEDKKTYSNKIVYESLKTYLGDKVYFCKKLTGVRLKKKVKELNYGEVLLLENTRFMDLYNNKESSGNLKLSKEWASLGDLFINDAYGMMHRKHSSNYGISKYLESGIGFLVHEEVDKLKILESDTKPYTIFMGGAKLDKIDMMKDLLDKSDYLLLGGVILNTFLKVNYNIGNSLYGKDYLEKTKELLTIYKDKIIIPNKVIVLNNNKKYTRRIDEIKNEDVIYDIDVENYYKYIDKSKLIFVNGTPGLYENKMFEEGTKNLLTYLSNSKAKVIIGGGDALSSTVYFNIDNFYFKSTGGGATLSYAATHKHNALKEE